MHICFFFLFADIKISAVGERHPMSVSNVMVDADGNVDCGLGFRCRPLYRVVSQMRYKIDLTFNVFLCHTVWEFASALIIFMSLPTLPI